MLAHVRFVRLSSAELTARYMSSAAERVTTGKDRKSEYYQQIAANQSESNEKPAGWDTAKPYSDIPGPKPIPVLGNLWRFLPVFSTYAGSDILAQQERINQDYGPIVKVSDLKVRRDMVCLFDPKYIETVYRNEGVWPFRDGMHSIVYYRLKIKQDVFQGHGGVLTSNGKEWFEARRMVNPPLMQPRSAQQYIGVVDSVTQEFIQRVDSLVAKHPQGEMPEDFRNELAKWALESICAIGLNKRLGLLNSNLSPDSAEQIFINDVLDLFILMNKLDVEVSFWKLFSTPVWRRYVKTLDRILDFQLKTLDEAIIALKQTSGSDRAPGEISILEQLLQKDKKIAFVMMFDMLMAGIDTTSRTTGAALYFLAKNQKAQDRLRAEVKNMLRNKDSPVTKEALSNMPYLRAVIKETTRMAPISIGNMRRLPRDIVLGGYQIPKGVDIISSNLTVSFQDKYFPRAKEFIPERWLKGQNEQYISKDASPFSSLPFGFGPRSCVGRRLAQMELEIILAKIARNYSWTWPHEDMKWVTDMLYGVGSPLQYHMKPLPD